MMTQSAISTDPASRGSTGHTEAVTLAARREHDAHVCRRLFHLFRLPAALESRLLDLLGESTTLAFIAEGPPGLSELAPGSLPRTSAEGPLHMGDVHRILDADI